MSEIGFSKLQADHHIYKQVINGQRTVIMVWVDDLFIFTKTVKELDAVKQQLKGIFDVKDIGEPGKIIDIEI